MWKSKRTTENLLNIGKVKKDNRSISPVILFFFQFLDLITLAMGANFNILSALVRLYVDKDVDLIETNLGRYTSR